MAVIESKGDGYSLYNGVKLPSLPVWDKETYPYAYVCKIAATNFGYFYSSAPFKMSEAGKLIMTASVTSIRAATISGNSSAWGNASTLSKNEGFEFPSMYVPIWANYDIINTTDGSVHLAASEPIALDGMNVIEWDGDTTGLESPVKNYYLVCDDGGLVDIEQKCAYVRTDYTGAISLTGLVSPRANSMGGYRVGAVAHIVGEPSETYPSKGVYLNKMDDAFHTSLFAYYPIEQEPEEPELSSSQLLLLSRMFSPVVFHALTGKWHWYD